MGDWKKYWYERPWYYNDKELSEEVARLDKNREIFYESLDPVKRDWFKSIEGDPILSISPRVMDVHEKQVIFLRKKLEDGVTRYAFSVDWIVSGVADELRHYGFEFQICGGCTGMAYIYPPRIQCFLEAPVNAKKNLVAR